MVPLKTEPKEPQLYQTAEGRVLWAGVVLSIFLILLIAYYLFTDPVKARTLTLVFFAHAFGGRAAAVGLCIMHDMKFIETLIYNFFLEIQLVSIAYSLFVLSLTNYIKVKWIVRIANQMMCNADRNRNKIEKYGWLGVFLFVMAPLPGTGPVMGTFLGYLLKLGIWRNFSAALSGTFGALLLWTLCFEFMEKHLHMIQYILGAIVIYVIFSYFETIRSWFVKPV